MNIEKLILNNNWLKSWLSSERFLFVLSGRKLNCEDEFYATAFTQRLAGIIYVTVFNVQSYALLKNIPESFIIFVDMNYEAPTRFLQIF